MVDEETGEEGFLSQFNDTFYTPSDGWETEWEAALVAGRFRMKNNGKGARKVKRGRNTCGKIRPKKFKKGRAHVAEYEDDYWDPSYEEYDYGEESYYGFKGGGKYRKGKGRGKNKRKFPFGKGYEVHEQKDGVSPKEKGNTLARPRKMEKQMLQALSQLHKMLHSQMPPMVQLGMDLHTVIRQKARQSPGRKNTMIPKQVIHGTPRTAMDGEDQPRKQEAS